MSTCADCNSEQEERTIEVEGEEHTYLHCPCYEPVSAQDALAGATTVNRRERHEEERNRTLDLIRENGANPATASPALKAAAITHFGSWENACHRACPGAIAAFTA
jgi:hypothetical protein